MQLNIIKVKDIHFIRGLRRLKMEFFNIIKNGTLDLLLLTVFAGLLVIYMVLPLWGI